MEIKPKYNVGDTAIIRTKEEYRIGKIASISIQGNKIYYYFEAIAEMMEEEKQKVNLIKIDASRVCAVGDAANETYCGLGYVTTYRVPSFRSVGCGSRLCFLQRTEEVAKYYGKQFIELWAEYNDLDVIKECKEFI